MRNHPLGIYEKALAKDLSWPERLVLAKSCGFDFVEMSVDETDERLSRLDWSPTQRASLVTAMLETGALPQPYGELIAPVDLMVAINKSFATHREQLL